MFRLLPTLLPFSFAATLLCRFGRRGVTIEIQNGKGLGSATGPEFDKDDATAGLLVFTDSDGRHVLSLPAHR